MGTVSKRPFYFVSSEDTATHKKGVRFTIYATTEQEARNRLAHQFPGTPLQLIDVGDPA